MLNDHKLSRFCVIHNFALPHPLSNHNTFFPREIDSNRIEREKSKNESRIKIKKERNKERKKERKLARKKASKQKRPTDQHTDRKSLL